ncbi:embryonic stem cell-specific 5-hydroxymethylcytosine-binding protein [Ceratitis capitata]|uniref:embryonic stem cell-specific 5-hydroxymethylcytosine-binding protein n=1 Tax=Ceratitis capitata TaxID=7213 RepID=UPI0006189389|nr:embryonic stem cell-specific 5-hydroxymethylcytosine-binding protein [Ceratitis capitata]
MQWEHLQLFSSNTVCGIYKIQLDTNRIKEKIFLANEKIVLKMCGRTCLTLQPKDLICACKYKSTKPSKDSNKPGDNTLLTPEWRSEYNCGRKFEPSYNMVPSDVTPVIVSADHFNDNTSSEELNAQSQIIVPMMWGMIPFWHKGDYRRHGLTTNNCRLEHMLESKLYSGPFRKGQRCVVLCEGFYEWQTTKSAKPSERAAHLLYMPQSEGVKIYDKSTWAPESVNLLKMAGLFDVWEDENGDKMFSYSIITFESSKIMSWLHHRMPAILETEQQVNDWIDFKRVSDEEALATLRPATKLEWYQVSNLVNNSRNKSEQCNRPIELKKMFDSSKGCNIKNKTLLNWLNVRKRREDQAKQLSDDESTTGLEGGSGTDSATSESDAEVPSKKPRFCDYKRSLREAALFNTALSADNASEKPQTCDES